MDTTTTAQTTGMSIRPIYMGALAGSLAALMLALPLYLTQPDPSIEAWWYQPAALLMSGLGYLVASLFVLAGGYGGACWSWAAGRRHAFYAGLLAGLSAGVIAWLLIGAGAAGVAGHRLLFAQGQLEPGTSLRELVLAEAAVQTTRRIHGSFWVMISAGALLGAAGGSLSSRWRAPFVGTPPQPLSSTLLNMLALTIFLSSCLILLFSIKTLYLYMQYLYVAVLLVNYAPGAPLASLLIWPTFVMSITLMLSSYWVQRRFLLWRFFEQQSAPLLAWLASLTSLFASAGLVVSILFYVIDRTWKPALGMALVLLVLAALMLQRFARLPLRSLMAIGLAVSLSIVGAGMLWLALLFLAIRLLDLKDPLLISLLLLAMLVFMGLALRWRRSTAQAGAGRRWIDAPITLAAYVFFLWSFTIVIILSIVLNASISTYADTALFYPAVLLIPVVMIGGLVWWRLASAEPSAESPMSQPLVAVLDYLLPGWMTLTAIMMLSYGSFSVSTGQGLALFLSSADSVSTPTTLSSIDGMMLGQLLASPPMLLLPLFLLNCFWLYSRIYPYLARLLLTSIRRPLHEPARGS